jgi:superfamily II DNA or RNA helicase
MPHSAEPQEAGHAREAEDGGAEDGTPAGALAGARLTVPLWPHQERALAAFGADQAGAGQATAPSRGDERSTPHGVSRPRPTPGSRSTYLVIPPGGGKTMIGLEAARRAGRRTLVLCPNTAIQAQWISQWHSAFGPPPQARATARRDLPTALTVLTYQAVATFDALPANPPAPPGRGALVDSLHANGRQLLAALKSGSWTLVLDECHHLLEIWGQLLAAIVAELDDPVVIGLTATPPHMMTADQAAVHRELFGSVDLEVSAPALVRDGHLAPYQELAWFTTPTAAEADYIGGQALRFAELRAGLLDPGFAGTPFLEWLQQRVVERAVNRGADVIAATDGTGARVPWERFCRDSPALADAALRLHADGLLPLPEGARLGEQHRHPPTAEDWVALIGDWCRNCLLPRIGEADRGPKASASRDSAPPDSASHDSASHDKAAYAAIRAALPSIGYRLTKAGIRAAESPVDRVLARSEGKALAAVEILRAEAAELGGRLRALVLTDFAEAGAMVGAELGEVLAEGAGGALLALATLLGDEATAALDPVLMTGQRVACGAGTAARLVEWLRAAAPELGVAVSGEAIADEAALVSIAGGAGWEPRRYVPLVTEFFAAGRTRCLVGTRALLGEGWDAPAVNVTVDLTAATTPTSVVQARGRALRKDAGWPEKVADNWAVVCVTGAHPKGAADYDRFVRKHDRYFALAQTGDIASGVAHVDPALSPFEPPDPAKLEEVNARMAIRAGERHLVRERWNIGEPYADEPVATVTVAARKPLGLARGVVPPGALPAAAAAGAGGSRPQHDNAGLDSLWALSGIFAAVGIWGLAAGPPASTGELLAWLLAANPAALGAIRSAIRLRRARRVTAAPSSGSVEDMAAATADALREAGMLSRGGSAVLIEPLRDGSYRARLTDVSAAESATFAAALDEVLSPLAQPRYIVPRLFVAPPASTRAALRLTRRHHLPGGGIPATVVYHAVPTVLGVNARLARTFARAWNERVSPGALLYAGSPEGAGILAAQRGDDPFDVTTQIRTLWR